VVLPTHILPRLVSTFVCSFRIAELFLVCHGVPLHYSAGVGALSGDAEKVKFLVNWEVVHLSFCYIASHRKP
jgi:hypothetical protein